ncbi:hypothetical protein LX32DRAFT_246557 [Colletotrichum zoysiae]|uniref:Uncharacterized protein n=1 Tax=Colletotrichum zoysiae TaxID=1216348 RepID=A0AAD9M7E8_9PEZI|nr:hypothetical protein LX32DRAFT_246557 [Colletotrichum zoysiae]
MNFAFQPASGNPSISPGLCACVCVCVPIHHPTGSCVGVTAVRFHRPNALSLCDTRRPGQDALRTGLIGLRPLKWRVMSNMLHDGVEQ